MAKGTAVRLSDEFVELVKEEASVMQRSVSGQVEYWASLGRRVEASGISYEQIRRLVIGGEVAAGPELSLEQLDTEVAALDGSDTSAIAALRARHLPVAGEDEDGKLVVRRD